MRLTKQNCILTVISVFCNWKFVEGQFDEPKLSAAVISAVVCFNTFYYLSHKPINMGCKIGYWVALLTSTFAINKIMVCPLWKYTTKATDFLCKKLGEQLGCDAQGRTCSNTAQFIHQDMHLLINLVLALSLLLISIFGPDKRNVDGTSLSGEEQGDAASNREVDRDRAENSENAEFRRTMNRRLTRLMVRQMNMQNSH